jgi:hypothetical protein
MAFQERLPRKRSEAPPPLHESRRPRHSLEVTSAAIRPIRDDQTAGPRKAVEYQREPLVPKDEDAAATFSIAVTSVEQHIDFHELIDYCAHVSVQEGGLGQTGGASRRNPRPLVRQPGVDVAEDYLFNEVAQQLSRLLNVETTAGVERHAMSSRVRQTRLRLRLNP